MKTMGVKASTTNTILAIIADRIGAIASMGGDYESIYGALYGLDPPKEQKPVKGFDTGEDFLKAWREINGGN